MSAMELPVRASATLCIAFAFACGPTEADETPAEVVEAPSTGAAQWQPVRRPSDAAILEQPAHVVADASSLGEIAAPVRARVARVHVRVGESVDAGDPVLDVVMPEVLEAAAKARGAAARIASHRARADELDGLRAEGIVQAGSAFEQRAAVAELEAERASALAVLRAASIDPREAAALLRDGVVTLRAPTSGVVRSLDATLGETREPGGEPFARIVGAGAARIEVRSGEPLPVGAEAAFEAPSGAITPLAGTPIASVVDADGATVTWFAPREDAPLAPGLRGRVRLTLAGEDLFELPAAAVVVAGGADGAAVHRRSDDGVEVVSVRVVASSGATAIVRGPLREGDLVAAAPEALEAAEAE